MRLWMVESLKVFETLKHLGRLTCDDKMVDPVFLNAYRWMAQQMRNRLGPPPPNTNYPLWAWARWDGVDRPKPDLRSFRHYVGSGMFVRLEIELPDSRILLSDYEAWHAVLNGRFLSGSEIEYDTFDRGDNWTTEKERDILTENSWGRVFDLDGGDPYWRGHPKERRIQATFWSLDWDNVVGEMVFEGAKK